MGPVLELSSDNGFKDGSEGHLDKEEMDEGLLGDKALVVLGEEIFFEEELGATLFNAERLGAAVR